MKPYLKPPLLELLAVYLLTSLVSCEKPTIPDVSTAQVTDITQTGAISGGNVKNNGGEEVTARGACWSIARNPTIGSSKTTDGTGNGNFVSKITGLSANTTYYVRAYAINSEGIGYGNEVSFETQKGPPEANFTASPTTITAGQSVQFTDQSTNNPTSWSWNFGDGSTGTSQNPSHTYTTVGTFTVILTVNNDAGSDTETKSSYITVNEAIVKPVADFTASPTTITEGQSVQFTDHSMNNPTSWSWNFGDDSTSTSQNPSHTYTKAGTYTVILTVTNSAGSDTETKTGYITVSVGVVKPVAAFTASPTTITSGQSVQFTDQSKNNPTSWSWSFGDGSTSTLQNPSHTYTTPGTYTVSLTSTNSAGSDTKTKTNFIALVAPPIADFTVSQTNIKTGQSVQFTDQSKNNPTSWSWNFGDGGTSTSQNPSHTYTALGTYTVSLTSTNSAGSDTETKTNFIVVIAPPEAAFTVSQMNISAGQSIQFTDQSKNNPTSWSWNFGDGVTSTLKSPSHIYSVAGTYTVTLIATNSAGSDTETKTKYITVNPETTVTDRDGNVYKTVKIGNQVWMQENLKTTHLNDGVVIEKTTEQRAWDDLSYSSYCWYRNDEAAYKNIYGALYNWYAVNTNRLCPSGWHVPTDAEWTVLENFLIQNGYNYDGTTTGNKIAKSLASATGWTSSTDPGTVGNNDYPNKRNASGFTGLPGGLRVGSGDSGFGYVGTEGEWWSSTSYSTTTAWNRSLFYLNSKVGRYSPNKKNGYSIRCLKN